MTDVEVGQRNSSENTIKKHLGQVAMAFHKRRGKNIRMVERRNGFVGRLGVQCTPKIWKVQLI